MSKKKETMTLWLTRSLMGYEYTFWTCKPRKRKSGHPDEVGTWDSRRIDYSICATDFHRIFPKAWRLKPGGGPLECVLTVKT